MDSRTPRPGRSANGRWRTWRVGICVVAALGLSWLASAAAARDAAAVGAVQATDLRLPSPAEKARMNANLATTRRVLPNALGLERLNRQRRDKGLAELATATVAVGSGSRDLSPAKEVSSVLYSTDFEDFPTGPGALSGHDGWLCSEAPESGTYGVYAATNQLAWIGSGYPTEDSVYAYRPVDYNPLTAATPAVRFSVDLTIYDSSFPADDVFGFALFNTENALLAQILFDTYDHSVWRSAGSGTDHVGSYPAGQECHLEILMNFATNGWSANLNGVPLFSDQVLHDGTEIMTLGDVAAVWAIYEPGSPGDNVMTFDNYRLVLEEAPRITTTSPLPAGRVGAFYEQTLAAAGGTAPYTWSLVGGDLPDGLELDASGVINGTPTAATTADFAVGVMGDNHLGTGMAFSLTVAPEIIANRRTITFLPGVHGSLVGGTPSVALVVSDGAAAPAPPAVRAAANWTLAGWSPALPAVVSANLEVTAQYRVAGATDPTGAFEAILSGTEVGDGHGWWDLTGTYVTTAVGQPLTLALIHDPTGRLSGTATYTVAKETAVNLAIRGSVKGIGGATVARFTLQGGDRGRTVAVSLTFILAVDAVNRQLTGELSGRILSQGTVTPVADPVVLDLPGSMDGTWSLQFDLAQNGTAVTGSAELTWSNLAQHRLAVRGRSAANGTAVLSLAGDPNDPAAQSIRIRTTITPLEGGWTRLESFSARGYGQTFGW